MVWQDDSMKAQLDIQRTDYLIIDRYAERAEFEAASGTDEFLEDSDYEGATVWRRVSAAVDEMRRVDFTTGDAVNSPGKLGRQ